MLVTGLKAHLVRNILRHKALCRSRVVIDRLCAQENRGGRRGSAQEEMAYRNHCIRHQRSSRAAAEVR